MTKTTKEIIHYIFLLSRSIKHTDILKNNAGAFSLVHFMTLHYIAHQHKVTMKEIANWLKITPSSATSLINGLVKKNLVQRKIDKNDRRVIYLMLTSLGKDILAKILRTRNRRIGAIISRLKQADQEMLLRVLKKLYNLYK